MKKLTLILSLCLFLLISCNNNSNGSHGMDGDGADEKAECSHEWVNFVTEASASCTNEGKLMRSCKICSQTETVIVEKLPHTPVVDRKIEPSCDSLGLTEGSHCDICGEILNPRQPISKLPHTVVADKAKAATCTSTGLTEGSHCSECGEIIVTQNELPKLSHTYTHSVVQPTCGSEGYDLYACSCGDSYKRNITEPTIQHNFVLNSNCVGYTCSVCKLEACIHGNVDGSISGGNNKVKFYITGPADESSSSRTLVIYGNGKMCDFSRTQQPLWMDWYAWEITEIVIEEGITYIGAYSFYDYNNYGFFNRVKSFIIKGDNVTIGNFALKSIKCKTTYQ